MPFTCTKSGTASVEPSDCFSPTAICAASVPALMFSLYLTNIEQNILEVWCLYCVMSQVIMGSITLLATITAIVSRVKPAQSASASS